MRKEVPRRTPLSTVISPPRPRTIEWGMAMPRLSLRARLSGSRYQIAPRAARSRTGATLQARRAISVAPLRPLGITGDQGPMACLPGPTRRATASGNVARCAPPSGRALHRADPGANLRQGLARALDRANRLVDSARRLSCRLRSRGTPQICGATMLSVIDAFRGRSASTLFAFAATIAARCDSLECGRGRRRRAPRRGAPGSVPALIREVREVEHEVRRRVYLDSESR
jgi:hypothetical protein